MWSVVGVGCRITVDLSAVWIWFADNVCREYSPIYDRVSRTVAASDEVLSLVREAPPRSHQPNVLLAAVHYLLLGGLDHPLAAVYAGVSDADPPRLGMLSTPPLASKGVRSPARSSCLRQSSSESMTAIRTPRRPISTSKARRTRPLLMSSS